MHLIFKNFDSFAHVSNSSFQGLDLQDEIARAGGHCVLVRAIVSKFAEATLEEKLALLWMSLQAGLALTVSFDTSLGDMVLLTRLTKLAVACLEMLAHQSIIWSQGDISCVRGPFG